MARVHLLPLPEVRQGAELESGAVIEYVVHSKTNEPFTYGTIAFFERKDAETLHDNLISKGQQVWITEREYSPPKQKTIPILPISPIPVYVCASDRLTHSRHKLGNYKAAVNPPPVPGEGLDFGGEKD